MGMYTGLRIKVIVKPEYREMINEINNGANWSDFEKQFPFLKDYASNSRAEFIPNGALAYMPDEWEEAIDKSITKYDPCNYKATDGFDRNINMQAGLWTFQCSLKNYENEIEQFFDDVLRKIISESIHIEYLYEEWDNSVCYELKGGHIKEVN